MQKINLIIIILISYISLTYSQNNTQLSVQTINEDSLKTILPNLKVFIDSALNNSPLIKVNDIEIDNLLQEIKINKKSWLQFFTFDANTKYGLYNQLSISDQITSESPEIAVQSNKEQFNYFAGITIKIPLTTFTNKKNELKIINNNIEEFRLKKEQLKKEITTFVIDEYFKLVNFKETLTLSQNVLQIMKFNYLKSEREVQNGVLSIADFSVISANYYKAEEAYSKSKNEFKAQLYKLNILTGINVNVLSK
jgi:outer membrane protein TolC